MVTLGTTTQYLPVGQEVPVITLKTKLILTVVAFFVIPLRFEEGGDFLQRTFKNFQITFENKGGSTGPVEYVKNIQISKGVSFSLFFNYFFSGKLERASCYFVISFQMQFC